MYIQINTAKVSLEYAEDFVVACDNPDLHAAMAEAPGFVGAYLLRSSVDPEEFVSVSLWDSADHGNAFMTGPSYAAILGGVRTMLLGPLDRSGYDVRIDYTMPVKV